jgi:hypothetical protein
MKRMLINHLILLALLVSMGASAAGAQTTDPAVYINEIQVSTAARTGSSSNCKVHRGQTSLP